MMIFDVLSQRRHDVCQSKEFGSLSLSPLYSFVVIPLKCMSVVVFLHCNMPPCPVLFP